MTTLTQGLIQLSGQPLVHALGWTLLHFCWQGLAVAALLRCVLGLLGGRSSQARYGAACLALALMVALPAATFAHIASAELKARAASLGSGIVLETTLVVQAGMGEPIPPWPVRIGAALDHSLPWILLAWFVGVVVFVGRLNFGLVVARRLKTAGTEPVPAALQQAFDELRIRLGVERAVRLVHSMRVQVPTVIGWLQPVVLLPVTCLTGLTPEQIEAVLCHELAHVRRHDYLVSVIQSVIETVLFYHPAVWWVSKQVRRERECCCDELAVAGGGDVLAYARALSFLEENRAAFPQFVLGANGGVLTMRIKRILGTRRDQEGSPVAALLALGMIVAVAGSYFIAVSRAQAQAAKAQASYTQIAAAAEPAGMVSVSQEGTATSAAPATDNLRGDFKVWLEQDVRWIITDREAQQFRQLTNDRERDQFIEQFWQRRNPHPDSPDNEYRNEHYARIAYSNGHFAAGKPGWTTDRGHIYIVYGKPESVDSHPSGGTSGYPDEVWHYKYIAGIGDNVDIRFVDTCNCGQYNMTIDRPGFPGPGAQNGQARAVLASRILAPGGASAPQGIAPSQPAASASAAHYLTYLMPGIQQADGTIERPPSFISGTIVDPNGALVPRAQVTTVNTDTGAKAVVQTDNTGTYSFSPLPPGPYNVEVEAKGFQRLLQENVHVNAGQGVGLNLKLTVGAAAESLTVKGSVAAAAQPASQPQPAPPSRPAPPKPTGPQRVSSGVMAGLIISKVNPVYPDEAKAQHIQGIVVLHAHIAKDGTIKDVQVVSGPPALIVSSIDAVRQWKYKPYLIDGEPTEVDTTININYTLADSVSPAATEPPGAAAVRIAPSHAIIRSIDYNGLNTIAIYEVVDRFNQNGVGLKLETPYDVASTTQAATVLKQLLAEHGRPNSVVTVSLKPVSPGAVGIQFNVDEGPKGAVQKLTEAEAGSQNRFAFNSRLAMSKTITASDPAYPSIAKAAHVQGAVVLLASVAQSGEVQDVKLLAGAPMLVAVAMEQARQQKFDAAKLVGEPAPVSALISVNFVLDDSAKFNSPPELIYKVDPEFSAEARQANFQGIVLVSFIVDPNGAPQNVHVVRGVGMGLDEKAVEAIRQYRFKPAFKDGKPVSAELNVEVDFQTPDSSQPQTAVSNPSGTPTIKVSAQYGGVPVQKLDDGVTRPVLINKVYPEFSEQARKEKFNGGVVLVNFIVDKQGKPQSVHVLRRIGHGLDQKAVEAVKQYRFEPATKDGNAVPVQLNVEVNFQIF